MLGPEWTLAARAALASRAQGPYESFHGRCWGRTAPSTSSASWPSPAPSASMPRGLRATWKIPTWMRQSSGTLSSSMLCASGERRRLSPVLAWSGALCRLSSSAQLSRTRGSRRKARETKSPEGARKRSSAN